MKVVIISDAHGNVGLINRISMIEADADAYIDAGDSELDSEHIKPFISVKGNMDYHFYPLSRILYFEDWKVFLTHGASLDIISLTNLAKSHGCNVLIYGHTHKYDESFRNSIYVLNPGSIARPRDGYNGTYMVVEFNKENIKVQRKEVY